MDAPRRIVLSEKDFLEGVPDAAAQPRPLGAEPLPAVVTPAPPRPLAVASAARPSADQPRVGGWGVAIFLFGLIGGAVGYFALRRTDPRRADHVLKWALMITAISVAAWILLWVIVLAIIANSGTGGATGALGSHL
jgi:hypothetical protein